MDGEVSHEMELWGRWIDRRDASARDSLIRLHAPWARWVAKGVFARVRVDGIEWHDFAQTAMLGLIEAADRYDPGRGVDFRTYAKHRVRGAVFNVLRKTRGGWQHPVDSAWVERSRSLADGPGGEDPLQAFVSWVAGMGMAHLLEEVPLPEADRRDEGPYASAVRDELRDRIHGALERLPPRERGVLAMHYLNHVPFVEIARQLGLTKGRVSQLHRQGLQRMRSALRELASAQRLVF